MRKSLFVSMLIIALFGAITLSSSAEEIDWVTKDRIGNPNAEITLKAWLLSGHSHLSSIGELGEGMELMYEQWARKHPNVKIEVMPMAGDIHANMAKLLEQAKAGRAPDIASVDSMFISRLLSKGEGESFSEYLTDSEKQDFMPFIRDLSTDDNGEWKGLLYNADVRVLFYRKDLVSEAPKTWDELLDTAKKVSDNNPGITGYLYNGGRWEGTIVDNLAFFKGQGGQLFDENGKPSFNLGKNREYMLNTLKFLKETIDSGASHPKVASFTNYDNLTAEAISGRVAMFLGLNDQITALKASLSPEEFEKWDVAPIPMKEKDMAATGSGSWTLTLFSKDPVKKRLAFNFIWSNYGSAEGMATFNKLGGYVPTRMSIAKDYTYFNQDPFMKKFMDILAEGGYPQATHDFYPVISKQLQIAISQVLTNLKTPSEALDEAWDKVMRAYEKENNS